MGKILLFDDEIATLKIFEQLFKDIEIDSELIVCSSLQQFNTEMSEQVNKDNIRCFILDLAKDKKEETSGNFEIAKNIDENFHTYRVPIFIHSGNLLNYGKFEGYGTVLKIEKGKDSVRKICDTIKLFEKSGFLELFSPGGILEGKLMKELHESFISQFKENNIEDIIKSVSVDNANYVNRVEEIFTRISVRSFISKLLIPLSESELKIKVNAVEHYYRRMNNFPLWTGDIFVKNDDERSKIVVLTPRCDIANKNTAHIAICKIIPEEAWPKDRKAIGNFLTDNIQAKKFRYLPKTPIFIGGKIDYSSFCTIEKDELLKQYTYNISLSDDLTNEIIAKYCSYMLRTGIEEIDIEEVVKYLDEKKS